MKKGDILALITDCQKKVEIILQRTNLTKEQKEKLETMSSQLAYHYIYVDKHVKEDDTKKLEEYATKFSALQANLTKMTNTTTKKEEPKKVKVTKVIKEEKQKESTKKKRKTLRNILLSTAVIGVIVAIVLTCSKCSTNNNKIQGEDNKPGVEDAIQKAIGDIDLDNEEELREFAEIIKGQLGETNYTTEDIMAAIRLANFDRLQNKSHFADRETVMSTTAVIGDVTTALTSDSIIVKDVKDQITVRADELANLLVNATNNNLTLDDFTNAKMGELFDVYKIADVCIKKMNEDNEKNVYFAKAFNELMARQAITGSITPNSPVATNYSLAGMYNANTKRINELTAGRNWGPIYGDGEQIDGSYGFICVEELSKYLKLGNEDNIVYTVIVDELITSHYQKGMTK